MSTSMKWSTLLVVVASLSCTEATQFTNFDLPMTQVGDKFYYYATVNRNWQGAKDYCHSHGLKLVTFETLLELNSVGSWLIHHHGKGFGNDYEVFTSGTDAQSHGIYKWSTTNQPIDYNAWAPNQPDNKNGIEHCLTVKNVNSFLKMNDYPCHLNRYFVCESPKRIQCEILS